jgi:hypothetical protein
MDLRGVGRGASLARRTYHAGCSDDVRAVVDAVRQATPHSPLGLVGFSLGGNIVLKLAGEAARRPVPGLAAVAALAPPVDLERCARMLARRANRLYELYFVHGLIRQIRRQQRCFPDLPRSRFPDPITMRLFDDLYTAPRWGFADALDYYRRASAAPLLSQIAVATYILAARDDPFIAVEPLEAHRTSSRLEIHLSEHGGHLGFLGADGSGGFRWAERRLIDWLLQQTR